jgi:polyisoprenoid-binding protein YceI
MKLNRIFTIIPVCLCLAATAFGDAYNIDPNHTSVGFSIKHLVINKVNGKFTKFSGEVVLDDKSIKEAKATIQTSSIDTGIAARDKHLKSPDFFDAEKYPTITFVSKRTEKKGDEMQLIGDFTMHGVTKELAMPVTISGPIQDPWGKTRIGIEAKAKVNRKDYGIAYNQTTKTGGMVVGEDVQIEINAEAVRAEGQ